MEATGFRGLIASASLKHAPALDVAVSYRADDSEA